ncbi:MAG: glycosyl hydrolase [bacterium]
MLKLLLTLSLALVLLFHPLPVRAASPNSPMGITSRLDNLNAINNDADWLEVENIIKLMYEAGIAWDRLFIPSERIITETGGLNTTYLTRLDRLISLYNKYNLNVYFLLFNSSHYIGYAGDVCDGSGSNPIDWPYNYWHSPPQKQNKWEEYLSTLVDRYKNSVKYWEISFEPNYSGCQFALHPDRYVSFLQSTASTIRQHDSGAKIILGRLLPNQNANYLSTLLQNGAGSSFDIVSLGGPYQCESYGNASSWITAIRRVISKPIWLTEVLCTSDSDGDGLSDSAGDDLQKTFISQIYRSGANKVFFNSFIDRNSFPAVHKRMSGLVSQDDLNYNTKPAFVAYQQAATAAGFPPPAPLPSLSPSPSSSSAPSPSPSPTLEGDFNRDGHVNVLDYSIFLSGFGTTYTVLDYSQFILHFGE